MKLLLSIIVILSISCRTVAQKCREDQDLIDAYDNFSQCLEYETARRKILAEGIKKAGEEFNKSMQQAPTTSPTRCTSRPNGLGGYDTICY